MPAPMYSCPTRGGVTTAKESVVTLFPIDGADWTVDSTGSDFSWGGSGFQGLRYDAETGNWYQRARYTNSTLGVFQQRDPLGAQYQDGMNLGQIVGGNPIIGVDPSGKDRYVGGTGHKYLAVDTWELSKNNSGCPCWKKTGTVKYDMSVRYHNVGWVHGIFNGITGILIADGEVVRSQYKEKRDSPDYRIYSTPEGDQLLKLELDMQADDAAGNPGHSSYYSAIFYNCRDWVARWQNYELDRQSKHQIPICP